MLVKANAVRKARFYRLKSLGNEISSVGDLFNLTTKVHEFKTSKYALQYAIAYSDNAGSADS